mgnify:FL=1
MPKQRTYAGTKKGTSMARQGRRSRLVGGGNAAAGASQGKTSGKKDISEDKKSKKDRSGRSFLTTLANFSVDIIVGAVIAIAVIIGFWASIPSPLNIVLTALLGALIVFMIVLKVRQSRSADAGYRGATLGYKIKKFFGRV